MNTRLLALLLASAFAVRAAVLEVDQNHPDADDGTGTPFRTIQAAIDAASPSDTVHVAAGVYVECVTISKPLTLTGSGPDLTILDGARSGTVVSVTNLVEVRIASISIRNGRNWVGAGLFNVGLLRLLDTSIVSNEAFGVSAVPGDPHGYEAAGAGLYNGGVCQLQRCIVAHNWAVGGMACEGPAGLSKGGGIHNVGTLRLDGCLVMDNDALGGAGNLCWQWGYDRLGRPAAAMGGGIYSLGPLRATASTFIGNRCRDAGGVWDAGEFCPTFAGAPAWGGGAFLNCDAQFIGCLFESNRVLGVGSYGGAIFSGGNLTVSSTVIRANIATGRAGYGQPSRCSGSGNNAFGGGIACTGTTILVGVELSENNADGGSGGENGGDGGSAFGGGIHSSGPLSIADSRLLRNSANGGAGDIIFASGGTGYGGGTLATYEMVLERSVLVGNRCSGGLASAYPTAQGGDAMGAGAYIAANAKFENCTVSGNSCLGGDARWGWFSSSAPAGAGFGGGLFIHPSDSPFVIDVFQSTICSNQVSSGVADRMRTSWGAGVLISTGAIPQAVYVRGSIVSGNRDPDGPSDVWGPLQQASHSLFGLITDAPATGDGNQIGVDPRLGPLQDNGGPTPTHALLPGSPALDEAPCEPGVLTDQRGFPRPFGAACDIGAFESQRIDYDGRARDLDFDGNRAADIAVFHPQSGEWYVLLSQLVARRQQTWGWREVIPVPSDYDGDGKFDVAAYHPGAGRWYILASSNGTIRTQDWGWPEAVPTPMDYDGDGRCDVAVYHPARGDWYILKSTNGLLRLRQWGWGDAIPVPGDYDGDGKWDLAVYSPTTGTWFIRHTSDGSARVENWGWAEADPVPADYDGDGKTDLAVYHRATGTWYVQRSSNGSLWRPNWGWAEAWPVPADYDRDGPADLAVYHAAAGDWYLQDSSTRRLRKQNWGWPEAKPVARQYWINRAFGR